MGALATNGWRSRALSGLALLFGVATIAFLFWDRHSLIDAVLLGVWSVSPFIALAMYFVVSGGRTEKKLPPKRVPPEEMPPPPVLNLALTSEYLNELVSGHTELECQRRIAGLANQIAQLKGPVRDLVEGYKGVINAKIGELHPDPRSHFDWVDVTFRNDQAHALEAIKKGDWIEFRGEIAFVSTSLGSRWSVCRAIFVGRAEAPVKSRRARTGPRSKAAK